MLNETYKNRIKYLAGLKEGVQLISGDQNGRSDAGTLGYYVEQYLLDLTSQILNAISSKYTDVQIDKSSAKISENTLIITFNIQNQKFLMTSMVSFEKNSNTSVSITNNNKTEEFNLSSKHNKSDIELFIKEIMSRA